MQFKHSPLIRKHVDALSVNRYLASHKRPDGSYSSNIPSPRASLDCMRILNLLGSEPKHSSTLSWFQSLQTGRRGFAESTGQNSWDYTTRDGCELHHLARIEPRYPADLLRFIYNHQNHDGGFSSMIGSPSNIRSSLHFGISLAQLGETSLEPLMRYLHSQQPFMQYRQLLD
jgi:hypothetical protein